MGTTLRRHWPTVLGVVAAAILAWYLVYMQLLVREMRADAAVHSRMYVTVFRGLGDPSTSAAERALLDLSQQVQQLNIPIVVLDAEGAPYAVSNLPFPADPLDADHSPRLRSYVRKLASQNDPIIEPALGTTFFFGDPPLVARLRWIPWLQVGALGLLVAAAGWMVHHNQRTERERIWAAMARESAHQMGTPLSSLSGWVEILRLPAAEREELTALPAVAAEMEADLERLEKVSHRFEWIGRPVRREPVDVRALLRTLERYVRVRLPQFGRGVELHVVCAPGVPPVWGSAVLLEWALENLVKNALDALAGSGGRIEVRAERAGPRRVAIRVEDNGPGVAPSVRKQIFDPGVTTKKGGWGVGLSLARRVVEDVHKGRLALLPAERGATFVITLPAVVGEAALTADGA